MTSTREFHVVIGVVWFDERGVENVVDFPVMREVQTDVVSFREEFLTVNGPDHLGWSFDLTGVLGLMLAIERSTCWPTE